jgi:hypothetical protein
MMMMMMDVRTGDRRDFINYHCGIELGHCLMLSGATASKLTQRSADGK